ncbi:MAG: SDR family NAD(P)-dependent oxidoreductase [Phormidesmis sp.]
MTNNLNSDQEMFQWLSQYFATRGDFLAQVIRADMRTLPHYKLAQTHGINAQNGHYSKHHNGNVSSLNGHNGYNNKPNAAQNGYSQNGHHHSDNSSDLPANGSSGLEASPPTVQQTAVQQASAIPETLPVTNHAQVVDVLVNLIVDKTGYPKESIALDARLLDDLNLDSIKAGEVVASTAKQFDVTGELDPATLANVTLGEVAQAICDLLPADSSLSSDDATGLTSQPPGKISVTQMLLNLVEESTGFPQSSLAMDMRLLDDLNLDSIKAADLVARAAKQLEIDGQLDPANLANATLADVVVTLEDFTTPTPAAVTTAVSPAIKPAQPAALSKWVRNFAVDYVEENLSERAPENWSQAKVRLVADDFNMPVVVALADQLQSLGGEIVLSTFPEILSSAVSSETGYTHIIAVLPQPAEATSKLSCLPLEEMISRLKGVTSLADAAKDACVAYVQFGEGTFGTSGDVIASPESCCAAAFARSLHLERPSLRVRVVDLSVALTPEQSADRVIAELAGRETIITAGYDAEQMRRVPQSRLQQPATYTPREQNWSSQDVILVTGGAKGITAECALAIAKFTGAKMALVGRSAAPVPGSQNEIVKNLARYRQQDLTAEYYSCDIANPEAVNTLVQSITTDLGSVTGVIHGAGLNTPRRVEQVSLESAQKEVSPKLVGAQNLLHALADYPPKLFLAFTSIIGITGMPGNSWYGFANESLALLLRQFSSLHPETQVVSLAYSVWDEVGMGARMGSVKNLARMGIGAISPHEGIGRCVKLFHHDPGVQQVVISAQLGGLDTWSPLPIIPTDGLRFMEKVTYLEPNVELKVRTHLTLEKDLYVKDHIWRGSYLFPTVFGLEAMAQAAAVISADPNPTIVRLENISLRRPIVVNPDNGVDIEIHAEMTELNSSGERQIAIGIRTEQTGFNTDHFSATLILGERQSTQNLKHKLGKPLAIEPKRDLYGGLLFQGTLFQQMDSIYSLSRERSILESHAQSSITLTETGFPVGNGNKFLLGDPYLRDVLLQCMQLNIPQDICLPVEIERVELCQDPVIGEGRRIITAILNEKVDKEYICEVVATDEAGTIVEHLHGYRLRILEEHPENPTAAELASPEQRDQKKLQQTLIDAAEQVGIQPPAVAIAYAPGLGAQTKTKRRQVEKRIVGLAINKVLQLAPDASAPTFTIRTHSSGKPYLSGKAFQALESPPALSISHDDCYCLCTVADTPQGCDIESIDHRSSADWVALLSNDRAEIIDQLVASGDERDVAGTRVWSALEALHKAFNGVEVKLSLQQRQSSTVLLHAQTDLGENYYVLTSPVQLTRYPERMVAMVVEFTPEASGLSQLKSSQSDEHPVDPYGIIQPGESRTRITEDGPQEQPVYEKRFPVTFKEGCSISRKVTVSQYISWVGKIRELPMRSMADQMIPDFLSGEFGMVTNSVSLRVLGEATTYDTIQARCWLGNLVNSSFSTYMEFCKVLPDESLERIAMAEVNATWVRLLSYGIPSPEKMPDYLQAYMDQFTAKSPAAIDLEKSPTITLQPLPESLSSMPSGDTQYQSPKTPYGDLLFTEVFQTTLEEANLVGNVYYGNYFIWQGRVIDLLLYSLAPDYFRVSTAKGEVISLYSHMNYMREAMPFDKVRVYLYLHSVTECGAVFNFEFFREMPDGKKEKLHTGQQKVIWANRQVDGTPIPAPWPEAIRNAIIQRSKLQPIEYAAVNAL